MFNAKHCSTQWVRRDYGAITYWSCTDNDCQVTCVSCCSWLWGMKREMLQFRSDGFVCVEFHNNSHFSPVAFLQAHWWKTGWDLSLSHAPTPTRWCLCSVTTARVNCCHHWADSCINVMCSNWGHHGPLTCVMYSWGDLSKCLLTLGREPMTDESEDASKAQLWLWVPLWGVIWVTNMSVGKWSLIGADKIQRQLNHQNLAPHGWGLTS